MLVERRVIDVGETGQYVCGERRIPGAAEREDPENRRIGRAQVHDGGVVVGQHHRGDVVPAGAQTRVVARVHHGLPRKAQVAGIERRAVRPLHPVPKVQRDRLAVAADPAVLQRRHRERHLRHVLAPVVIAEDRRGDQVRDLVAGVAVGKELVERVGFFRAREPQAIGLRPRMQSAARRGGGVDARAAGSSKQCGERAERGDTGAAISHSCGPASSRSDRRLPHRGRLVRSAGDRRTANRFARAPGRSPRARPPRRDRRCSARPR